MSMEEFSNMKRQQRKEKLDSERKAAEEISKITGSDTD